MKIAIASGKGGTGKTTIAVNLAAAIRGRITYADCDVEAPNGHLFLHPVIERITSVNLRVPRVDTALCDGCGRCAEVCAYHAVACIKGRVLVFSEMCHGCGGCAFICPTVAISEVDHAIGAVENGHAGGITFISGKVNVGAALSPPVIRAVKGLLPAGNLTIIDAPPGTSCPMGAAVRDSDFVVLATEPTPFGLHDLSLAVDRLREFSIPFGVVINRMGIGDHRVHAYCAQEGIPVLLEIPDDRRIAEAYSKGLLIINAVPEYREVFERLLENIVTQSHSLPVPSKGNY